MSSIPKRLVVGVWQGVCVDGDLDKNIARTEKVIDEAAEAGCDFVCLPETFLSGCGSSGAAGHCALALDDKRMLDLARRAGDRNVVTLVGFSEKRKDGKHANSVAIFDGGKVIGTYSKTQLTGGDAETDGFCSGTDLPIFKARGVNFAVQICHDSSFPEIAATYYWKGAQILFSPHYNWIPESWMDDHRVRVRNNHVGAAVHNVLVVARSNTVVVNRPNHPTHLGYGDSAIFASDGAPLAEAGLFKERLVHADVAPWLRAPDDFGFRHHLQPLVFEQLVAARQAALARIKK